MHMAQLRRDYPKFKELNSEVLVVVPNGPKMIASYVAKHANPYPILSDKGSRVAKQYGIETQWAILLTTMTPTVFLVDTSGVIRYASYGTSYIKKPDNREPLAVLARMHSKDQVTFSP